MTKYGWVDTNVPNFGGMGYVYLVKYKGLLIQLDVYLLPEKNSKKILDFNDKKVIFTKGTLNYVTDLDVNNHNYTHEIKKLINTYPEDFQLFFDTLLHFEMLAKYICRKNVYLAYKYWYLLNGKILLLIRTILEPKTGAFMFYDVSRQLDKYHYKELAKYETHLRKMKGSFDKKSLLKLFKLFVRLIKSNYPSIYVENNLLVKEVNNYIYEIFGSE